MDSREIIDVLARNRVVEQIVAKVAHVPELSANLRDLSQMVYLSLLTYDPDKLREIWERDQILYFIARIVMAQYHSTNRQYYREIRRFSDRSVDLAGIEFKTEDQ